MADGAHAFSFTGIGGGRIDLRAFAGKPVLVVNTASQCGFTPQYAELAALDREYGPKGLVVLGVPSNDFGAQEPGSEADIQSFCASRFQVEFPMTAKQKVVGADAYPFYRWVADQLGEAGAPRWNFHKYLIDPEGRLAGAWPSKVAPRDKQILDLVAPLLPREEDA